MSSLSDQPTLEQPVSAGVTSLTTQSGFELQVRPARKGDEERLIDFFRQVSPEDLRFRFLSGLRQLSPEQARELVQVDHERTENFLGFDRDGVMVATAMLAIEPHGDTAEVAIAIRADCKHRGVGWTLLGYVAGMAAERGVRCLQSIESAENRDAIGVERAMGFTVCPYRGDPTLRLVTKELWTPQRCA